MGTVVALWVGLIDVAGATATPPTPATPTISLSATHRQILAGKPALLSGYVHGEVAPVKVALYSSPYPYRAWKLVGTTTTKSNGAYAFNTTPDRNTRYRTQVVGTNATAHIVIAVIARVSVVRTALTLGRAQVVIVVDHPADLKWWHPQVQWSFASGAHHPFMHPFTNTATKLSPSKTQLEATVTLPAGLYRFQACFRAPEDGALADSHRPAGCAGQGFQGTGHLPHGFPGPAAIARAEHYLASRGGHTAIAVMDSEGRMHGVNLHQRFITGSVVKAMLLVAYLRRLNSMGHHSISSSDNSILYPMIHVSDNNAATTCWQIVGNSGLYEVAHAAGMTRFSVQSNAWWGSEWGAALLTAADQARFFFNMDNLIPKQFVGYANYLLSHIAGYESWGIPAVARPLGYTVYFKAGWRPSPSTFLVHQIARLVKGKQKFAVAIMTDGDPDMTYGIDTIQGTAQALLG